MKYYGKNISRFDDLCAAERVRTNVARLSSATKSALAAAWARHEERACHKAQALDGFAVRFAAWKKARAMQAAKLYREHYRTASGKWAGGNTSVALRVSRLAPNCGATTRVFRVWSPNGKYSGNDLAVELTVSDRWRTLPDSLRAPSGILTVWAEPTDSPRIWAAKWLVQGRGFETTTQDGFLAIRQDGHVFHAKTRVAAEKSLRGALSPTSVDPSRFMSALAWITHATVAEITTRWGNIPLTFAASVRSGNCPTGTRQFREIHFPGRRSATVAECLEVAPENARLRRLIAHEIATLPQSD